MDTNTHRHRRTDGNKYSIVAVDKHYVISAVQTLLYHIFLPFFNDSFTLYFD